MNKSLKRKGFSLIEVLIALTVITVTFVTITGLVSRNLQSNLLNQNVITSHYLNAEAIEIVRNMRDSGWLQNFGFNSNTERLWGESLWPGAELTKLVQIDRELNGDSPWSIKLTNDDFELNRLFLNTDEASRRIFSHRQTSERSNFSRYVELSIVDDNKFAKYQNLEPLRVTAFTSFKIGNKQKTIIYSTILTDWKQGPL